MAFWGIEVKPGKPFTQKFDDYKGRLHVSLATLGFGTATKKSVLQCNVGNKSPVYLCSLFPEKTECLQLNLEYEEADEVIFSVIGPRSIHLSGYFLGSYRHNNLNDDTESYGEDIANTETQSSEYGDEDKYEDSFINDTDPEVFPPSPVSKEEDETLDKNKTRNKTRNHRRLRKSYQMSESDDDEGSQHKNIASTGVPVSELESLDVDNHPISSLCKGKTNGENGAQEKDVREREGIVDTGDGKTVFDGDFVTEVIGITDHVIGDGQPNGNEAGEQNNCSVFATEVCPGNVGGPTKLVKAEEQTFQAGLISSTNIIKEASPEQSDATIDKLGQHLTLISEQETDLPINSLLHSSEVSTRVGGEQKKKRKERSKRKPVEADGNSCSYVLTGVDAKQDELNASTVNTLCGEKQEANTGAELLDNLSFPSADVGPEDSERPKRKKKKRSEEGKIIECDGTYNLKPDQMDQDVQPTFDQTIEHNACSFATENHSVAKKIKKKKKSKSLENGVSLTSDISLSSDEKKPSATEIGDKESNGDTKASQVKTLPRGLIIEELESGKSNGKIATSEKKISVLYVAKLKESGEIFESTDDGTPYKFRLGVGQVIEGWDAGLEGMRVGEKRRLTIPPSMGYGSEGDGENIPPDSWLVYEVELVKVH